MDIHSDSATHTLDRIRHGGNNLVLTAHQRLAEIKKSLDHGRFNEAFTVASSLQEKLGHLASAEGTLGRLSFAHIMRVGDVEIGMKVVDAGVVSQIGPCSNCEREECDGVTLTFESGHQVALDCDDEVAITVNDE